MRYLAEVPTWALGLFAGCLVFSAWLAGFICGRIDSRVEVKELRARLDVVLRQLDAALDGRRAGERSRIRDAQMERLSENAAQFKLAWGGDGHALMWLGARGGVIAPVVTNVYAESPIVPWATDTARSDAARKYSLAKARQEVDLSAADRSALGRDV